MTNSEFTAWLRGFVSGCDDKRPTPAQWAEIRRRLAGATENSISIRIAKMPSVPDYLLPGLCPGDFAPSTFEPQRGPCSDGFDYVDRLCKRRPTATSDESLAELRAMIHAAPKPAPIIPIARWPADENGAPIVRDGPYYVAEGAVKVRYPTDGHA